MNKKHYEVVCGIIIKDNKIFACQRNDQKECALLWEFPGGKIEIGETKEQAIIRELKEELDADIVVDEYIGSIYHEYETFTLNLYAYKCTLLNNIKLLEHLSYQWLTKEELKNNIKGINFAEADKKIIELL